MKSISLQKKFFLFSLVAGLSVLVLAWESYNTIHQLISSSNTSNTANSLIQNHLQGDMMHDAIRGDVLRSILAAKENDSKSMQEAAADLEEHSKEFTNMVNANLELQLPEHMHSLIVEIAPKLGDYQKKAKEVMNNLASPEFAKLNQEFADSFEAMEEAQGKVSDSIGEWSNQINAEGAALAEHSIRIIMIVSAVALLFAASIPLFAKRTLFNPLYSITSSMKRLADGDLEINTSLAARGDEIGQMGKSLQIFKESAIERRRLREENKQAESNAQQEKKQAMEKLASDFESEVQNVITAVSFAADGLCKVSETMQKSVAGVDQQSKTVASISQGAASNVANVSAAVEEMSASVKEIASQVSKSTSLISETVTRTSQADKTTHMLSDAVAQISGILQLIQDIAGQINLLALNATIESARAGEAGKGFAVVASEVKNLASQTTKATEEIAKQIENVQHASKEVVEVLKNIQEGITNVNQYSSGIASAVEEQSAAAREISANMQHAALGVQDINGNITGISKSASEADQTAKSVLTAAQTMSQQSDQLKQQVTHFLSRIRA